MRNSRIGMYVPASTSLSRSHVSTLRYRSENKPNRSKLYIISSHLHLKQQNTTHLPPRTLPPPSSPHPSSPHTPSPPHHPYSPHHSNAPSTPRTLHGPELPWPPSCARIARRSGSLSGLWGGLVMVRVGWGEGERGRGKGGLPVGSSWAAIWVR